MYSSETPMICSQPKGAASRRMRWGVRGSSSGVEKAAPAISTMRASSTRSLSLTFTTRWRKKSMAGPLHSKEMMTMLGAPSPVARTLWNSPGSWKIICPFFSSFSSSPAVTYTSPLSA